MAKSNENTALPVARLSVADVPAMLEQVEAQIKELQGNKTDDSLTTGTIPQIGTIDSIQTSSGILKAASVVLAKEKAYKEAVAVIVPKGLKAPAFEIDGMSKDKMINHLRVKYSEIYNADKLKDLKEVKRMLEENLSAEMKLAKTLEKIHLKINKS